MNTPAHLAASVLVWRGEPGWSAPIAVALGAFLPDLPMFGFYFYQKIIGNPEREIWSTQYFRDDWQLLFDVFNSIPLAVLIIAVCQWMGLRFGVLMAASALLHMLCDLPVHHDDAHRHFLPLTGWRFYSPLSYWDPKHFGRIMMPLELVFAITACGFVAWRGPAWPMRGLALATLGVYALGIAFAAVMWMNLAG